MRDLSFLIDAANRFIWGAPLLVLLILVGGMLTFRLRAIQFRYLFFAHKLALTSHDDAAEGDISQFEALMTTLAATIGTGSIAGVATAIVIGGVGSLFWMWIAALLGMVIRFAESILAVKYRSTDTKGEMCGGPMYYIERGMSWKWLAVLFAIFGIGASFGIGNTVQANSVALAAQELVGVNPLFSGVILTLAAAAALFGGIKKIGKVASFLVPIMATFYLLSAFIAIFSHISEVPRAFCLIIESAFTGQAASGGFVGSTMMLAVQMGLSRGIFSSEAGLGSSPIASAAARTQAPGRQAMISMCGVFITTGVVCTLTGLVIALSGTLGSRDMHGALLDGAALALHAFERLLPFGGGVVVTLSLIPFAYTTIIAWAYYGEKCIEYLLGLKAIWWYRIFFIALLVPGSTLNLQFVWSFANLMNGLMAIPNLIALFVLRHTVVRETKIFLCLLQKNRLGK